MFSLAIETSSSQGSVALGRGDELLAVADVPQHRRHNLDLMPTIAGLCVEHGATPADLGEVYVSLGPGSFTGLRIGIATAKMLALARGVRLVGVPTLDVLVQNAPHESSPVAVGLNLKHQTIWSALYTWRSDSWRCTAEPALRHADDLRALGPGAVLGDPLPPLDGMHLLPPELAVPRAEALWRLGHAAARAGRFTDALQLTPLYVREPEAVALWDKRHGPARPA